MWGMDGGLSIVTLLRLSGVLPFLGDYLLMRIGREFCPTLVDICYQIIEGGGMGLYPTSLHTFNNHF